MTNIEIKERLQPILLVEGNQMGEWLESEVDDTVDIILGYVNSNSIVQYDELPDSLYWICKRMVQVAFNRQRSEGLTSHTEGGETMSWSDNGYDPLEPFIQALNDFIDGSSKRHSWDFF